jgi:hypothetical protein
MSDDRTSKPCGRGASYRGGFFERESPNSVGSYPLPWWMSGIVIPLPTPATPETYEKVGRFLARPPEVPGDDELLIYPMSSVRDSVSRQSSPELRGGHKRLKGPNGIDG